MDGAEENGISRASWWRTPWSVAAVVNRDAHRWRRANSHLRALALSRVQRELLFAGEHPLRFVCSFFLLLLALAVLTSVTPSDWLHLGWTGWGASEQLTHFSTLWAVQATLAALVYPIVIAFVTVFLQRRPLAEAFVHLYILDSGALAAGLSSVALVVVMDLQYLLIGPHGTASLPVWVGWDAVWFLMNAVLTSYFLFRSVEFLRPEIQTFVMRRYAVVVALPRDVARLYAFQVLAQAQKRGWIPAPGYLDEGAPEGPKVLLSRFTLRGGNPQGELRLREPARLQDVRLWPLRAVVLAWMRRARQWPIPVDDGTHGNRRHWPLLTVNRSGFLGGFYT